MKNIIKSYAKVLVPASMRPRLKVIGRKIYFLGPNYKCPFCKSPLRTFLPGGFGFTVLKEKNVVGGGYRTNNLCPICNSLDRERLLFLYLLHKTDIFGKTKRVLHIAPEAGVKKILSSKVNLDYVTADLYMEGLTVKMDITDIRFPANCFDVIICNHVLEHILDDRKAMTELFRVLKPDGWAILQVPMSMSLDKTYEDFSITTSSGRQAAFGQDDHVRIYAKDYKLRLAQAGFRVNVFEWTAEADNFGGAKNVFGLNPEEVVHIVRKPIS